MPVLRRGPEALVECVCRCTHSVCGTLDFALKQGWRNISISEHPPPGSCRTFLGFCPGHARQYGATGTELPERRHTV